MDEPRAVAEILGSREFAWPDLTGRKVLLIAVGESELAVDALEPERGLYELFVGGLEYVVYGGKFLVCILELLDGRAELPVEPDQLLVFLPDLVLGVHAVGDVFHHAELAHGLSR